MHKMMLALLAATALAAPSAAQERPGDGVQTRADVEARVREGFQRLDANRDGFLTQAEAQALRGAARAERRERRQGGRDERFARLDTDRDGSIGRDEFLAPRARGERGGAERRARRGQGFADRGGGRGGGFGAASFARADSDRDGRVSLAEAIAVRLQRFERIDADRDGRVTAEERRAAWSARRDDTR